MLIGVSDLKNMYTRRVEFFKWVDLENNKTFFYLFVK